MAADDTVVASSMCKMNMTIHAIQSMQLFFSVDIINSVNARLLLKVMSILQQTVDACTAKDAGDLKALLEHEAHSMKHNNLCTWRPMYCLDMVLYIEQNKDISVGIPLYDCNEAQTAEIKFFKSQSYNKIDVQDCVCLAHLTCDTDANSNHSMVILVYDIILKAHDITDTSTRYAHLRDIEHILVQLVVGQACVRVQWAGDCMAFDKIQTICLPHAHDTIVIYGDHHAYHKFKLGPLETEALLLPEANLTYPDTQLASAQAHNTAMHEHQDTPA